VTAPRQAAARLVNHLKNPPAGSKAGPHQVATVTAITAGGAVGGGTLVTVSWRGTAAYAAYGSTYTPAVGHVVLCAYDGTRLTIIDRIIGQPPET
jgi:hypothetical protein